MRKILIAVVLATSVVGLSAGPGWAAAPPLEPMYANDTVVHMLAPRTGSIDPAAVSQDFYLIAYPFAPANGQLPLCNNNCPGPPDIPQVRDVVLKGSPGFGSAGTAGKFNPNWHVLALVYSPAWLLNPAFAPVRSAAELDAGETAGHFLPINVDPVTHQVGPGGNPFEFDTGIVFVCVLVSSHA